MQSDLYIHMVNAHFKARGKKTWEAYHLSLFSSLSDLESQI